MSDLEIPIKGPGRHLAEVLVLKQTDTPIKNIDQLLSVLRDLHERHPESQKDITAVYGAVVNLALQMQNAASLLQGAVEKSIERAAKKMADESEG